MMPSEDSDALQLQPDPDKLYRYHRQQLSAMLDGELSPDQARFMLRRLEHDAELAACWERWQVCGDVLRGRHEAPLPADFAAGVARAIAGGAGLAERAPADAAVPRRPGLLRWGGGAALAASVAMVALLVGRQAQAPVETGAPARVASTPAAAAPAPVPGSAPADAADAAPAIDPAALALAGTSALAVAELPRREERRSRGQSQRAAATRPQRREEARRVAAVAERPVPAAAPAAASVAGTPDAGGAVVPVIAVDGMPAARPWPRSGLGASSPFAAGYAPGAQPGGTVSFHPFEPQIELPRPAPVAVWPRATAIGAGLAEGADAAHDVE